MDEEEEEVRFSNEALDGTDAPEERTVAGSNGHGDDDDLLAHMLRVSREREALRKERASAEGLQDGEEGGSEDDEQNVSTGDDTRGRSRSKEPSGVETHIASSASTRASFNITFNIG